MPAISLKPLPPKEAIAYFRGKGLKASFAWQDMWQEEHAKAFTVAKAMRSSVLQDIYDAVLKALEDGTTLAAFKAELRPKLEAAGWWGVQKMVDPQTQENKLVQLGSPRRLRTIFDVNMRTAHAAGAWQRIQETKDALQYLRYQTAGDERVRPEHQAWDGTTLPVDDDWWDVHNPPCDWGCRCTVVQISKGMLAREGGEVTDKPIAFPSRSYTNPRTGEVVSVEGGIGPGWGYNVGKAYLERETPSPMGPPDGEGLDAGAALISAATSAETPIGATTVGGELLLDAGVAAPEAIAAFLGGFGVAPDKSRIVADRTGDGLVVGPGLFKDSVGKPVRLPRATLRALPLIGLAIRQPAEIRRAWRVSPTGKSLLVRRFIGRFDVAGRAVDVVADWGGGGWWAATSIGGRLDLKALRTGAIVFSAI
jgi:SPP1 gp7 family putative phage head morphogenesis protein